MHCLLAPILFLFISVLPAYKTLATPAEAAVADWQLFIALDSTGASFRSVQNGDLVFKESTTHSPGLGRSKQPYWLHFKIDEKTGQPEQELILLLQYGLVDYIDWYYQENGQWQLQQTGTHRPPENRLFDFHHFAFPVRAGQEYYMHIRSENVYTLPFSVLPVRQFHNTLGGKSAFYGFFTGLMLVIIITNFIFYIYLKESYYLFYVLYMAATLLLNLCLSGHVYNYLKIPGQSWQNLLFLFSFLLCFLSGILFGKRFLKLRFAWPVMYRAFLLTGLVVLLLFPLAFFQYAPVNTAYEALTLVFILMVVVSGIRLLRQGNVPARFFVLAYGLYLLLTAPVILASFSLVLPSFLTAHGTQLAAMAEALVLGLALGDRYRNERKRIKQERQKNRDDKIKMQIEQQKRLEQLVAERTAKLEQAMQMLTCKNTEVEQQKNELLQQKQQLEQLNQEKDKLMSILAHDVRSPLNSLSSFTTLLSANYGSLSEQEVKTIASNLDANLGNVSNLLDNLLQWAGTQTGHYIMQTAGIDLHALCKSSIDTLAIVAREKNITLENHIPAGAVVKADFNFLDTVLRNLLSNAIKFSLAGGKVEAGATLQAGQWHCYVKDNGVGMQPRVQQKLFAIGEKHSTPGTKGEKGTGLGLILVHDFVKKMGGDIEVRSEAGKGTVFYFTLPAWSAGHEENTKSAHIAHF